VVMSGGWASGYLQVSRLLLVSGLPSQTQEPVP
jgi:hypothetical protein